MISVSEAHRIILRYARPFPVEIVPLEKALGRLLREDIKSDRDQPPFNKSLVDGLAIDFEAWQKGVRTFTVEAVIAPGVAPRPLKNSSHGVRIMTGGAVPEGCNCIIPVEQLHLQPDHTAQLRDWTMVKKNQHIRARAADGKKGEVLLKAGRRLWAPQIGVAASVGRTLVKVSRIPSVAVIATGNELVDIHKPVRQHQTRLSNSYALQALLSQGRLARVEIFHLRDNPKTMLAAVKKFLLKYDVLVLSGGVSMGDFDFVPTVLAQAGVKEVFHKVSQKPGKPFWFGMRKNKPVFALPGNPVSTQICACRYVVPYLKKASGLEARQETIMVDEKISIQSDFTQFLPVRQNRLVAIGGSGDFAALAKSDGFIEYESHQRQTVWPYFSWRI